MAKPPKIVDPREIFGDEIPFVPAEPAQRTRRVFIGGGFLLLWPGRRCSWAVEHLTSAAIKADRLLLAAEAGVDDFAIDVHRARLGTFAFDYGIPLRFDPGTRSHKFDPLYGRSVFVPMGQPIEIELTNMGARPFKASLGVLGHVTVESAPPATPPR